MKRQIPAAIAAAWVAVCQAQAGCGEGAGGIEAIQGLGGTRFWVSDINASGQMVGFSYLPGDAEAWAFIYGDVGVQGLGTLGGAVSQGDAINGKGEVVGQSSLGWETHAFLYRGGAMLDLGTLGGFFSAAVGVNDAGQVVGWSSTWEGFNEAFLYEQGKMIGLGSLGGGTSWANAINARGQVIGDSSDGYYYRGFLFDGERMIDLGDLGGGSSSAVALNDSGVVVGEAAVVGGAKHAFIWADGVMVDLGMLGETYSKALDVNEAGQVIGFSTMSTGEKRGFFYDGARRDLGSLGGSFTEPRGLNGLGQVVGFSGTTNEVAHAFAWQNGLMVDLNSLLQPDTGWELTSAEFINDAGHIMGYGYYHGAYSWFRISPGTQNSAPVAIASGDQMAECGVAVTLDGSQSADPDGDALSYEWRTGSGVLGTGATYTGVFPPGTHVVVLKVADPCGAEAQSAVTVVVVDTTPPVFTKVPVGLSAEADGSCQAAVPDLAAEVAAVDACGGSVSYEQSLAAGTILGLGAHAITVMAADEFGNKATRVVSFTVADKNPPTITSLSATPSEIQAPNRQMVPVTCSIAMSDTCDSAPVARIVSVECNEALVPGEVEFAGALSVLLAATRDASGDGRVYTLTVEARDAAGNASEGTVTVTVPKGKGNGRPAEKSNAKISKN